MTLYAKRKDSNTDNIMIAILECGWSYLDTHDYGRGFPDCIAYKSFGKQHTIISVLIEIKTKDGKLTKAEEVFQDRNPDLAHICRSEEDVKSLLERYDYMMRGIR